LNGAGGTIDSQNTKPVAFPSGLGTNGRSCLELSDEQFPSSTANDGGQNYMSSQQMNASTCKNKTTTEPPTDLACSKKRMKNRTDCEFSVAIRVVSGYVNEVATDLLSKTKLDQHLYHHPLDGKEVGSGVHARLARGMDSRLAHLAAGWLPACLSACLSACLPASLPG